MQFYLSFTVRAHHEVVALQSGDEINLGLWKIMCGISENMFKEVYRRLSIDERLHLKGESYYNDKLDNIVKVMDEAGMLKHEDNARLCFIEGQDAPLIIRKGDGGFGYDATDMAAIRHRIFDCKANWIIYVVDRYHSSSLLVTRNFFSPTNLS
jgi:arginyl-tRNA synthetase